jgi:hypothetical protein
MSCRVKGLGVQQAKSTDANWNDDVSVPVSKLWTSTFAVEEEVSNHTGREAETQNVKPAKVVGQ